MAQQSGGAVRKKHVSSSAADPYTGEDRISALHDDLLVRILLCLGTTAEAARTSVLSHRWRPVWKLLPELRFDKTPDLHQIHELIDVPDPGPEDAPAPDLLVLDVTTQGADPESAAAWLPAAARRVTGSLLFYNHRGRVPKIYTAREAAARGRRVVQLPCFTRAGEIELDLGFLELALPSAGTFARLTELLLFRVLFHGPCELGEVVSSPRCPSLQRLTVEVCRGMDGRLTIHSESLIEIQLSQLIGFKGLTVVAPALWRLYQGFCLENYNHVAYVNDHGNNGGGAGDGDGGGGDDANVDVAAVAADAAEAPVVHAAVAGAAAEGPAVHITAPQVKSLGWDDMYDPRYVHFGNVEQLKRLSSYLYVYLQQGDDLNHNCMTLLQRFQVLEKLTLMLVFQKVLADDLQYVMGDITMLPKIMSLKLNIVNRIHAFGACCFHLLTLCTSIQRLAFQFDEAPNSEVQYFCPSGCLCEQPTEWKIEKLTLIHLEEVVIIDTNGTDHEIVVFKRLLEWAVNLKRLRLQYQPNLESKANEVHQKLQRFARPETCITLEGMPN